MVKVTLGTNSGMRRPTIVSPETTIRGILEALDIQLSTGQSLHLDGAVIVAGDIDRSLEELGYDGSDGHDKCFLSAVDKQNNAAKTKK